MSAMRQPNATDDMAIDDHDLNEQNQGKDVDKNVKLSVSEMKEALVKNPYQYELYVKYLDGLRTKGRLSELKKARDDFSTIFAMTDDLWLQWIEDESSAAITTDDKRKILRLFDRAVQDYRSIRVWKEYLNFSLEEYKFTHDQEPEERVFQNYQEVEAIYDRAKTEFRYHLDSCHDFHMLLINFVRYLEQNAENDDQKRIMFRNKIRSLFHQALKTPCLSYQATKDAYCSWEKEVTTDVTSYDEKIWSLLNDKSYKDAVESTIAREKFEHELAMNSYSYDAFRKYIIFEKIQKDASKNHRVVSLFERAIIMNCLDARVWLDYIAFQYNISKSKTADCGAILRRAVKNVTWSADLWVQLAQNMESSNLSKDLIRGTFERALIASLPMAAASQDVNNASKLTVSYCSFLYRDWKKESRSEAVDDLRHHLNTIHARFLEHFPDDDPYARIERFQAKLEASDFNSTEKFTQIWTALLKVPIRRSQSDLWIDYIQNIKLYVADFVPSCTEIFQRLVNNEKKESFLDWPERIMDAWVAFVHQYGTLKDVENAIYHCKKLESILADRRNAAGVNFVTHSATQAEIQKNIGKRKQGQGVTKGKKRAKEGDEIVDEPSSKRVKQEKEKTEKHNSEEKAKKTTYHKTDPSRVPFTVFVSNLPESVTEENLLAFFGLEKEKVKEIRLVSKKTEKGLNVYAYVDFASLNDAKNALQKDRQPFNGEKVAYVAPFKPKDTKAPNYPLNPRKVHISNLPHTITEETIRELFSECGEITYLNLLNDSEKLNGKRPYAFIEFKEVSSGELALALHNLELGDVKISVKLARLEPPTMKQTLGAHFGKGHGGKNLAISLKPRTVKPNQQSEKPDTEEKKPKSNADFRAMLGV